jgi:hypothetical protein
LPHASGEHTLLSKPVKTLCAECHDFGKESFGKAHIRIDASDMDCMSCHAPHASKDPKFFNERIHPPFAGRHCEECHIVEK